jgi:hypothetical protein
VFLLEYFIVVLNISLSLGSGEPYVHEFKEFPGVTIIFRSAANSRAYGNSDGHGKASSRRKSEFTQSQLNMQDKFEHGDKTDHSGTLFKIEIYTLKRDVMRIDRLNSTDSYDIDVNHCCEMIFLLSYD